MERGDRESDEDMAKLVADLQKRMERTEVRTPSLSAGKWENTIIYLLTDVQTLTLKINTFYLFPEFHKMHQHVKTN